MYFLLYVDDGLIAAMGSNFEYGILGTLPLLQVLGFPLAGKKFCGGTRVACIGYEIDLAGGRLGITTERLASTLAWCEATAAARVVLIRDFRSSLGKLVFVAGPLYHIRPFLGPAFSWASAATGGTAMSPPIAVRATIRWVGLLLQGFPTLNCHRGGGEELFRVDAKAEGDDVAWIAGWSTAPTADPRTSRWFACQVTAADYPWVFEKGQPFKVIAVLELLATLYGVMLLVPEADHGDGLARVRFSAGTGNQSNGHLVRKMMTTKLPLGLVCRGASEPQALRPEPRLAAADREYGGR